MRGGHLELCQHLPHCAVHLSPSHGPTTTTQGGRLDIAFEEHEVEAIARASDITGLPAESIVRSLTMSGLFGAYHPSAMLFWQAMDGRQFTTSEQH